MPTKMITAPATEAIGFTAAPKGQRRGERSCVEIHRDACSDEGDPLMNVFWLLSLASDKGMGLDPNGRPAGAAVGPGIDPEG